MVGDIFHISQLHGRALFLDSLRKILDGIAIPKDGIDPLIFEAVRQRSTFGTEAR
jgi:hypothetical protein